MLSGCVICWRSITDPCKQLTSYWTHFFTKQFIARLFRQLSWILLALQYLLCPLAKSRTAKCKFLTKLSCWEDSTLLTPQKPSLSSTQAYGLPPTHTWGQLGGTAQAAQHPHITKEAHLPEPGTQLHRLVFAVETWVVAKKLSGGMTAVILNAKGTTSAFQKCHSEKNRKITTISGDSNTGVAERLISRSFCKSCIAENKTLPQGMFAKSTRLFSSCSLVQNWMASASITGCVKEGQTLSQTQSNIWI